MLPRNVPTVASGKERQSAIMLIVMRYCYLLSLNVDKALLNIGSAKDGASPDAGGVG